MSWLQAVILGIIQGLTEFLPVSSSAHLVIVPYLLGWDIPPAQAFVFDVLVQVATLVAVIIYFWSDLIGIFLAVINGLVHRRPFDDPKARMGWYLVLATIPAVIAGVIIKDAVEAAFGSPVATSFSLYITAGMLFLAERLGKRERTMAQINWLDALWIGLFQAVALFPGISRSGATITGGMLRKLDRPDAARFSFLMSVPVMIGAGLVTTLDLLEIPNFTALLPVYLPGFLAAAVVGYFAIRWLIGFLTHRPLYWFAAYCVFIATFTLLVTALGLRP